MNNKKLIIITLLTLLFCGVVNVFSQEWEVFLGSEEFSHRDYFDEVIELSNGDILATSRSQYANTNGTFFTLHPALTLISSDGTQMCRNEYMKPFFSGIGSPYIFEKNGDMYMLACYNPDHDINSDNYFKNSDNPPTDAILGLYKLDGLLNVTKSYEHIFPIDTFEMKNDMYWQSYPNIFCGNIFMYSAFIDEGNIVGSYIKSVSYADVPRGHDTIFFFKMDFDGNMLLKKGYEMHTTGGNHQMQYYRQQIIKNDNGYIVYYRGYSIYHHGTIEYYDKDFNNIATRYFDVPDFLPSLENNLDNHMVVRSNHNTTYLATTSFDRYYENFPNNAPTDRNIRLYEIDDNLDNSTEVLPVIQYIERGTSDLDDLPCMSLDMATDGNIYFAYTLNNGEMTWGDSWIIIERLDSNLDTISTLFYDDGIDIHTEARCIKRTKDDGILLVSKSKDIINRSKRWSKITKFPASAFGIDNIEEAHAYGLNYAVAYPNPGGDVLNIRTGLRNAVLTVYDLQGRKIHEEEITDDVTSVDASGWQSGTYIWKLGIRNEELGMKEVESGKWVK